MPPPVRTPRRSWIDAGLALLAQEGPDAVRVEVLAQRLGVTRGGFYRQFEGRSDLVTAMLDEWEQRSIDEVRARVEAEGGDVQSRVTRAGALTFSDELVPLDLAVRDWARRDSDVAARLRRVDNRRIGFLRELLGAVCEDADEVEARALLAFSLAIGTHVIAADHPGPRQRVVRDATRLILAGVTPV
ncbi:MULTISPECIES: TetR/AcrR family transcriptional regulator [Mycolicibacterium]|uniref:TetR family transcriptional regulator n=1 Tax=Mycolicibacterium gilvum TaxID=1804 RepID=A0A378SV68_9MYCO|nr:MULTISPECIES: TetR/AcrR family transcriptional regulator [Mycolicibacterium]MBV5243818.1 TetR/AcrR family transcriptional regulator [Mycolicibacterium sp. PAM1]MCV7054438.1 TetR/AcrR family transcriptional regulator [Mycolicibacterium gilvum]STZ45754.1 TetR family transcriptional regulator [Mycolicibacterium gilvum]